MGKGVIKSGGTAGLYTIDVSRDTTAMDAWKTKLEQRLLDIADEITAADVVVADAKADLDFAVVLMNSLIDVWEESQDNDEAINAQAKVVAEKGKDHRVAKQKRDALVLDQVSIQKQINAIEDVDALIEAVAWCADYTEDLSGDVGTVEIPGDRTRLLIRPGDDGAATYSLARDGQLQPTQSSTAATVAWNYAMFPGWQKWIPQYRSATITAIDTGANTCTITFGAETSTAQGLDVNYITASSDIPISYMTCDHEAFVVGDMVLVEFESVTATGTVDNWANPKVIGFIDNPRECPVVFGYRVQPNPGCENSDNEECWNGWGAPFDDGGEPPVLINPPWGTAQSGSRNQSLLVNQGGWKHWRDPETQTWSSGSGTVDWQGNGMLIGWYGGEQGSRYRIHDFSTIYWYEGNAYSANDFVIGACIQEFQGERVIIIATDTPNVTRVTTFKEDGTIYWSSQVSHGTYDLTPGDNTGSFWLFNASGTEAVQTREFSGIEPTHSACHITSPVWRRRMRLTVSLRRGAVGSPPPIIPDITIADMGDEMPIVDHPTDPIPVFFKGDSGPACTIRRCVNGFANITTINKLITPSGFTATGSSSGSRKIYDFVGNILASAEFWYTRQFDWETSAKGPDCTIVEDEEECEFDHVSIQRRSGTYDWFILGSWRTFQTFPQMCYGESTVKSGVRFTGSSMSDIEYTAFSSHTGDGIGLTNVLPAGGTGGVNLGDDGSWDTTTLRNTVVINMAIPYLDMRSGQAVVIKKQRTDMTSDRFYSEWDFDEVGLPFSVNNFEQSGTRTGEITTSIIVNGGIVEQSTRENVQPYEFEDPPVHQFNPWAFLTQHPFRACRGREHSVGFGFDYLFSGPQKDPRPMASAGGTSYCYSYVDRWVVEGEDDPLNENVPPIAAVYNSFPIALNIPGTWPNAAPVTPVEPSS